MSRRYKKHVIELASVISPMSNNEIVTHEQPRRLPNLGPKKAKLHRSLIYDMTRTALKKVVKSPPPLEDWSSIERADKAARRACGLEDSKETRNVSIGMQLINQRLEIITADLPKEID